jgi:hypothetical protein
LLSQLGQLFVPPYGLVFSSKSEEQEAREAEEAKAGLYKLNPVKTHSLKAPGFNP